VDFLLILAQAAPIPSTSAAAETLSKGSEQQILAYGCIALGLVVSVLAAFIVKQWAGFKSELKEVSETHIKQLTAAYERLDKEQDERRIESQTLLRSVIEASQANAAAMNRNTETVDRLIRMIETNKP